MFTKSLLASAIASAILLSFSGATFAQAHFVFFKPVPGLKAPPAEMAPVTAPTISAPNTTLPARAFVVSWSLVPLSTRYQVSLQDDQGARVIYQGTGTSLSHLGSTTVGVVHAFQAQACNDVGCGPWSVAQGVAVVAPPPPPAVSINAPASVLPGSNIDVTWGAVADPNAYPVSYALKWNKDGGANTIIDVGTATSSTVANAGPGGSTYTFTVDACNTYACATSAAASTQVTPSCVATKQSFSTAGTFQVAVPAGCNAATFVLAGAGGGAGGPKGTGLATTGSGGALVQGKVSVIPGQSLSLVVGSTPASGGPGCTASNGYFPWYQGFTGYPTYLSVAGKVVAVAGGGGNGGCSNTSAGNGKPGPIGYSSPQTSGAPIGYGYTNGGTGSPSYIDTKSISGYSSNLTGGGYGGYYAGGAGYATITWSAN